MFERLQETEQTYQEVERQLGDPGVVADQARFVELSKRYAELGGIVRDYRAWRSAREDLATARQLAREERDPDARQILAEEIQASERRIAELEASLTEALAPRDPNDAKDVIVEVRAGTGGDEAALFAGELARM